MENENNELEKEKEEEAEVEALGQMAGAEEEGEVGSSLTMERVAAAKKYIENHYKAHKKHLQERRERFLS